MFIQKIHTRELIFFRLQGRSLSRLKMWPLRRLAAACFFLRPCYELGTTCLRLRWDFSLSLRCLCIHILKVRWQFLKKSDTTTLCPYKGMANCKWTDHQSCQAKIVDNPDYNVVVDGKEYKDLIWWYKTPTLEFVYFWNYLSRLILNLSHKTVLRARRTFYSQDRSCRSIFCFVRTMLTPMSA